MVEIKSPYVARLEKWGLGETTDLPFLLEHFIDGKPLREYISQGIIFSPKDIVSFLDYALQGLSACAAKGIVHRDIKPENIMLTSNNIPIIIDFGVSRHTKLTSLTSTSMGDVGMTPQYAPPEMIEYNKRAIDETTDLFSFGVVVYEMLTGRHPFLSSYHLSYPEIKDKMLKGLIVAPHLIEPTIPIPLSKYVAKLLCRERFERFRNVNFALEKLREINVT